MSCFQFCLKVFCNLVGIKKKKKKEKKRERERKEGRKGGGKEGRKEQRKKQRKKARKSDICTNCNARQKLENGRKDPVVTGLSRKASRNM